METRFVKRDFRRYSYLSYEAASNFNKKLGVYDEYELEPSFFEYGADLFRALAASCLPTLVRFPDESEKWRQYAQAKAEKEK